MSSTKDGELDLNHHFLNLCFLLSSMASLSIAAAILWALLSIHSPTAALTKFDINDTNIYVEVDVHNQNYLRGFNYTTGWLEVYYIKNNFTNDSDDSQDWDYITPTYQGFRKSWPWSLTLKSKLGDLEGEKVSMAKNETRFYISLYLAYWYKILVWKTNTTYYHWLEANVYLGGATSLQNSTSFTAMKNFNFAISS